MSAKRVLAIRDQCYEMLRMAQVIRIQQTQATADAKWPKRLTENADEAWNNFNKLSEAVDVELVKIAAELGRISSRQKPITQQNGEDEVKCKEVLRSEGQPYPRTCPVHGLSPCPEPTSDSEGLAWIKRYADAKGEVERQWVVNEILQYKDGDENAVHRVLKAAASFNA